MRRIIISGFILIGSALGLKVADQAAEDHATDRATVLAQEDWAGRIFLPLLTRNAFRAVYFSPPPIQPTEDVAGTPHPTGTPRPTPTPPPACRTDLTRRVFQRPFALDPGQEIVRGDPRDPWSTGHPIITAPVDDRLAWIGWSGTDGVHFTPILGLTRRAGPDFRFPSGETTHGAVGHADGGAAALIRHGRRMSLVRWDAQGNQIFSTPLVGAAARALGDKWIDDWPHEGRLAWDGQRYIAYFGHTQQWSDGRHQGDLLWHIDGSGRILDDADRAQSRHPSWDWGCSHSLDVRMLLHPFLGRLGTVCLSDEHPVKGFAYEDSMLINPEPSADGNGFVDAALGGLAATDDGFAVSYVSTVGRSHHDVALRRIYDADREVGPPWWLTDTEERESAAHLAAYGDDLLAGWQVGGRFRLAVVSDRGAILEGPVEIDTHLGWRDDFVVYPNGDVGWTGADDLANTLWGARVTFCVPPAGSTR